MITANQSEKTHRWIASPPLAWSSTIIVFVTSYQDRYLVCFLQRHKLIFIYVCLINKPHQNTQTQKRYISKDHLSLDAYLWQCGPSVDPSTSDLSSKVDQAIVHLPTMVNLSFFVHSIVCVVNRALVWMIFDLLPIMRCPRLSCQVTDKPALHEMSTFREARGYQTEDFFEMFQTTLDPPPHHRDKQMTLPPLQKFWIFNLVSTGFPY